MERLKPWGAGAQGEAALPDEDRGVGSSSPGGRGQLAETEARRRTVAAASTSKHASSAGCGSVTCILQNPAPPHRHTDRSQLVSHMQHDATTCHCHTQAAVHSTAARCSDEDGAFWDGAHKHLTCEAA